MAFSDKGARVGPLPKGRWEVGLCSCMRSSDVLFQGLDSF